MLFRRCEELINVIHDRKKLVGGEDDDSEDGILRLLSIAQARILIQKYQLESRHSETNYMKYYEDRDIILRHALHRRGHVEISDSPQAIFSKFIDLDLLDNLPKIDGFKKHIVQKPRSGASPHVRSVWETFISQLPNATHEAQSRNKRRPRNEYEACEIMIKNGAARVLKLDDDYEPVDLIQFLSQNEIFPEEKIGALEKLFPPVVQRPPKKKGRKRVYRRGIGNR